MARYIDAVNCADVISEKLNIPLDDLVDICAEIPTADVAEVKQGKWIKKGNEKKCSVCDFIYYSNNDEWSFCPNCGAKMDGGKR